MQSCSASNSAWNIIPWLKIVHDQCSTQDVLYCNGLMCKPRKKSGKENVHGTSFKRINIIAVFQNIAWSFWHIRLTFFTDTCSNLVFFLSFFCCEANVINGNKVKYSHVAVRFRLTRLFSVTSDDKQQSFNCRSSVTSACWNWEQRGSGSSRLGSCHQRLPTSTSHVNPAALSCETLMIPLKNAAHSDPPMLYIHSLSHQGLD